MAMQGHPPPTAGFPPSAVEATFELAYRTWGTAVLRYSLRRSTSREDALDVVAETFAIAWRRRADLPVEPEEVGPWLFGIARLCLANTARGTARAGRLGERLASSLFDAAVPDPASVHEGQADRLLMRRVLEQLSAEDRELITLIAWEGLTPAQAATALGLSAGAARVRLHRARTRLRKALDTSAAVEEVDRDH
jgi:RNA polymerase sigma-70 factor (ECF subfamily)